jgi:hypothetical protein
MANSSAGHSSTAVEALHAAALTAAALGLILGLYARNPTWVNLGVSLILLLPPLRLATTISREAHAGRYRIAAMGTLVLAFLLISRRIS